MMNKRFSFFILISLLIISGACKTQYLVQRDKTDGKVIILDSINVPKPDSLTLEIIKPYKAQLDSQMNEILAYSEITMYKDQPEGLLNNFVSDLIYLKGNEYLKKSNNLTAPICLLNYGGLRAGLPKGAITMRNVYELMPFENELVAVEIQGTKVTMLLSYLAQKGGMPETGIRMTIKDNAAGNVTIQGVPFDETKNYLIITSDYLAMGGDDMTFFLKPVASYPLGLKVRDAIIECLKEQTQKGSTVSAQLDKRIYYEK
jgi:2',3'-cyclic-nucleotide 2'-phosphodiesterase (5'-nucleotidase family)